MTFLEAALQILRREGRPLHYKEISDQAVAKRLLTFMGRTPDVTMQTQLTAAVNKSPGAPFVRSKPGYFGLLRYPELSEEEKRAFDGPPEPAPVARVSQDPDGRDVRTGRAGEAEPGDGGHPRRRGRRGRGGDRDAGNEAGVPVSEGVKVSEDETGEAMAAGRGRDAVPEATAAPDAAGRSGSAASADGGGVEGGSEGIGPGRRRRRRRRRRGGEVGAGASLGAAPVEGEDAALGTEDELGDDDGEGAEDGQVGQAAREGGEGTTAGATDDSFGTTSAEPGNGGEGATVASGGEGAAPADGAQPGTGPSGAPDSRRILTPIDAAIEILRGQSPGRGVHVRQIADAAVRRRLVHGEPHEAWRVMRAALAAEPKERLRNGQRPRVRAAGTGLFALARRPADVDLEKSEHVFGEARRALRERTLAALELRLCELAGGAFEALGRVLLQREGFGPATFVKRVEGTVYLEALRGRGFRPSKCLIALRPGGSAAGRRSIGELRAGVRARNLDEGVLLLAGRLADDGIHEWKQSGSPIEVADGPALAEACVRHGVGVINAVVSVDFVDADFFADLSEG